MSNLLYCLAVMMHDIKKKKSKWGSLISQMFFLDMIVLECFPNDLKKTNGHFLL